LATEFLVSKIIEFDVCIAKYNVIAGYPQKESRDSKIVISLWTISYHYPSIVFEFSRDKSRYNTILEKKIFP